MIEVKLENTTKVALIDEEDRDKIIPYRWKAHRPTGNLTYQAYTYIGGKQYWMHQIILPLTGSNLSVDHRDKNGLNNQKENLRAATRSQQKQNSRNTFSKGVTKHAQGKWRARIQVNGRPKDLGLYLSRVEAAKAYNNAAIRYFGEFASLNIIEGEENAKSEV